MQILGLSEDDANGRNGVRKRKKQFITFNDEEEVINPEDIDPTVGRFRNLVQTTVIPTKVYSLNSLLYLYNIFNSIIFPDLFFSA